MRLRRLKEISHKLVAKTMRVVFLLVGGLFKDPLLFFIGLLGLFTFIGLGISIPEDVTKKLDLPKAAADVLSALVTYFFFVKKNISAWKMRTVLIGVLEEKLSQVRTKLRKVGYELDWTKKDAKTLASTLFPKWSKANRFEGIESDFVESVAHLLLTKTGLTEGRRLFLEYVIYELFPLSRSAFLGSLTQSDLTPGSPTNEFASLFDAATRNPEGFNIGVSARVLPLEDAKTVFDDLTIGNIAYYRERLKNPTDRKALVAIAEQCIKMGYTSVEQVLKFRREQQPFKMLIKYDERFTYFDRDLKAKASLLYDEKRVAGLVDKVKFILNPYPFSQALNDFDEVLIKLLPRDPFVFLFDLNLLRKKFGARDPKTFMEQVVVPAARVHHEDKLKAIRKLDKVFAEITKQFTANYYLIDIDIETLVVEADNKSMPEGMKRVLVQDVLTNGDFAKFLSTQDLYIKKIIETMPLEALLFDADVGQPIRDFLKSGRTSIQRNLKSCGVPGNSIYEKRTFKSRVNIVTDAIYDTQVKPDKETRRFTKKEIKKCVSIISDNAASLVVILEKGLDAN